MDKSLTYQVLTTTDEIKAIEPQWEAILAQSPCNRAFSSPDWYLASCRFNSDYKPHVVVASRRGTVAGIFPLAISETRNVVAFPHAFADYNDLIAQAQDYNTIVGLLDFVLSESTRSRTVILDHLCCESNCSRGLDALCAATPGRSVAATHTYPYRYIRLPASLEEYVASRKKNVRMRLNNALRKAERELVQMECLDPDSYHAAQLSEQFLALHLLRLGSRSSFNPHASQEFLGALLPRLFASRKLLVFVLRWQSRILGIKLCMLGSDSLCAWNGGFAPEVNCFQPGKLLALAAIQQAFELNLNSYDLALGRERHKIDWATHDKDVFRFELDASW